MNMLAGAELVFHKANSAVCQCSRGAAGLLDGKLISANVCTDAFSCMCFSLAAHVSKIIYDNNLMLNFVSVGQSLCTL